MAVPDLKINVLLETGKWKEALAQSQTDLRAFASQAAASSASSAAAIKQIEDSVKGTLSVRSLALNSCRRLQPRW